MVDGKAARLLIGSRVAATLVDRDHPAAQFLQDEFIGQRYEGELVRVRPIMVRTPCVLGNREGMMHRVIELTLEIKANEETTYSLRDWLIAELGTAEG